MQKVTLNKNSWHYKYYSNVIGDYAPGSLCPYFWTMVLLIIMSPFFGVALILIKLFNFLDKTYYKIFPIKIKKYDKKWSNEDWENYFEKEEKKELKNKKRWDKASEIAAIVFKWVVLPSMLIGGVYYLYVTFIKIGALSFFIGASIFIFALIFIFFCVWVLEMFGEKFSDGFVNFIKKLNPFKFKVFQIIGQMIYAWYINACPIITWENNKENKLNLVDNGNELL